MAEHASADLAAHEDSTAALPIGKTNGRARSWPYGPSLHRDLALAQTRGSPLAALSRCAPPRGSHCAALTEVHPKPEDRREEPIAADRAGRSECSRSDIGRTRADGQPACVAALQLPKLDVGARCSESVKGKSRDVREMDFRYPSWGIV